MKSAERRLKIFEMIKEKKFVDVNELSHLFDVSSMTIRRDLARLENQGVVTTNYGGATLNEGVSSEPSFNLKSGYSQEYKVQIAYEASLLINDGDCIFIDCGTTTLELFKFIANKEITLITNSWKALSVMNDFSKVKVILAPGEYDPISEGAISCTTISFLSQYVLDKAFISTQGVDIDLGVSVPDDNDAQVKKAIMNAAKYRILLADHTKFEQTYLAKHGTLDEFDIIFTDIDINQQLLNTMRERKYEVVVCKSLLNKQQKKENIHI